MRDLDGNEFNYRQFSLALPFVTLSYVELVYIRRNAK
ncbi:hypothetical protein PSP6_290034 [Paraburkholderia tropica]|nr:hypothetical protein PSP6_290034 [Paraburkholderia tropica]